MICVYNIYIYKHSELTCGLHIGEYLRTARGLRRELIGCSLGQFILRFQSVQNGVFQHGFYLIYLIVLFIYFITTLPDNSPQLGTETYIQTMLSANDAYQAHESKPHQTSRLPGEIWFDQVI